jgi:hypothetical protein
MSEFFGRKALLERIHELHRGGQHVSVVGARAMGKTALLEAVVARHAKGSDVFACAGYVDFRHDPPVSTEQALRRVAEVLQRVFTHAAGGDLAFLAKEVEPSASTEDLYNQLKIALDLVAEAGQRLLLVLDGCDPVLQNSAIPRNLWDNLRALAQIRSLRLMTSSRDQLHRLCYNPEARTSDFFRIFYDEPLVVGPFQDTDWKDVYASCGMALDGSAEKALVNWTGGHPDLVGLLLRFLRELAKSGRVTKAEVDQAAANVLGRAAPRLEALWMDCPEESQRDIVMLAGGDLSAADLPAERLRYLTERGIAAESGTRVRLVSGFLRQIAGQKEQDVSGVRRLFERPEGFRANIRTVLELRIGQMESGDLELTKLVKRAVRHLPDEPDAALGSARLILDRALTLIWASEAPGGKVPAEWIDAWKFSGLTREVENFGRDPRLPEPRGKQCGLLRLATGRQFAAPVVKRVSKATYVLVEHMNHVGDFVNHAKGEPSLTMAVAHCLAAVELVESLARDLAS